MYRNKFFLNSYKSIDLDCFGSSVKLTIQCMSVFKWIRSYFSSQVHFWFPTAWCWWSVVFLCFTWNSLSVNSTGRVLLPAGVDWCRFSKVSIIICYKHDREYFLISIYLFGVIIEVQWLEIFVRCKFHTIIRILWSMLANEEGNFVLIEIS